MGEALVKIGEVLLCLISVILIGGLEILPEIIAEAREEKKRPRETREEREAEKTRMAIMIAKSRENEAKKYGNGNGLM